MDATITVYKLIGDRATALRTVALHNKTKDALLDVLAIMRAGLPADCVATLTDTRGHSIRP